MNCIELILLIPNIYIYIFIILFDVQYFFSFRSQKFILSMIQRFKSDKVTELSIASDFRVFIRYKP